MFFCTFAAEFKLKKQNETTKHRLAILVAYGAYKLYDLPVREWLKHKLFRPN